MQKSKSENTNQNMRTTSFSKGIVNAFRWLFSIGFFEDLLLHGKLVKTLKEYFENESLGLQNDMSSEFEYPSTMAEPPVRFKQNGSGVWEIYYVINFKTVSFFNNKETVQVAYTKSMSILNEHIMFLGLTEYIIPQDMIRLPDTTSVLVTYNLSTYMSGKDIFINLLLLLLKVSPFIATILYFFL